MKEFLIDYLKSIRLKFSGPKTNDNTAEINRIAALQKAAAIRRAEHADNQTQAGLTGNESLSLSRKRMMDAEFEHTRALQLWENKNSRQKC